MSQRFRIPRPFLQLFIVNSTDIDDESLRFRTNQSSLSDDDRLPVTLVAAPVRIVPNADADQRESFGSESDPTITGGATGPDAVNRVDNR